jgi:hypothetical protein
MKKQLSKFIYMILVIFFSFNIVKAENSMVKITKKDCTRLIHQIDKANIVYKPSVDIRGRKVTPADISSTNAIKIPDVFEFNIAIDIRKYLGGPENNATAASAAIIAANKSTTATTSAILAATSAEALATTAYTISTAAIVDALTAVTSVTIAKSALDSDPLNKALRDTWKTAKLVSDAASASAATASSDSINIQASASKARSAANFSESATFATDKASYATIAASEAITTAALATIAAGNDSSKVTLAAAANIASTAAIIAASEATAASNANTQLIAANRKSQNMTGLSMNVGKVSYNIKSGGLTFNGQLLTKADEVLLSKACQKNLYRVN